MYNLELEKAVEKIKKEKASYTIQSFTEKPQDFSEWAQKVIWYGHRRAAYFYDYNYGLRLLLIIFDYVFRTLK